MIKILIVFKFSINYYFEFEDYNYINNTFDHKVKYHNDTKMDNYNNKKINQLDIMKVFGDNKNN